MTTYLINSFPNALQPKAGESVRITGITTEEARELLTCVDHYQDYDDMLPPAVLKPGVVVSIGHQSVADCLGVLLANSATVYGRLINVPVGVARAPVMPQPGDQVVCLLSVPPRRLAESERWSVEEIETMPKQWVVVKY